MTILEAEIASLEGLDKAHHALYTQKDGKYVFSGLKGYDPGATDRLQKALNKERDNASTAANALKPWKTLFGDKTPEAIQAELDKVDEYKLAAKGKLDESAIEERVTARLGSATKPLERKLQAAEEKAAKAEARVLAFERAEERAAIRAAAQKAALESHADPASYGEDGGLLAVLEPMLKVEVVAGTDADGNPTRKLGAVTGRDGEPLANIIQGIQAKQGYFWGPSKGGGANGGNGGSRMSTGGNPWKKETFNRTEQMRLMREQPEVAKQMASQAGVKI